MSIFKQKTISNNIYLEGIGLHSGKEVSLKIKPGNPNTGIIFKRVDLYKNNEVLPKVFNVTSAFLCTTISNEYGVKVSTIEHLMGALFGLGIDNALIEIDNEEVPILDGSGKTFVKKIKEAGVSISNNPIKVIKIDRKIEFKDGLKSISIEPTKINLEIDFEIQFNNEFIGTQKNIVKIYEDELEDIYNSRTFCLYEDVEKLRSLGLAKGGSLDNAIVVKDNKILNKENLRNKKEFVNHKILDLVGDFLLSGKRILGKVKCYQGGHELTNKFLKKMFSSDLYMKKIKENEPKIAEKFTNNQSTKLAVNA